MADKFKTEGNVAFGQKKWLKSAKLYGQAIALEKDDTAKGALYSNRSAAYVQLGKLDEALDDANNAVRSRPQWSKAHARVAEVYGRQQEFKLSPRTTRVELVTNEASLKTLESTQNRAADAVKAAPKPYLTTSNPGDLFLAKVQRAVLEGSYQLDRDSGVGISYHAAESCARGMQELDTAVEPVGGTKFRGTAFTFAIAEICECVVTDQTQFIMPYGTHEAFPLSKKLPALIEFELQQGGCFKYFTGSRWSARDIIDDLDKRIKTDDRQLVRQVCSSLIRGRLISAFLLSAFQRETGAAILEAKFAVALLDEGNKKWAHESFEEKGATFRPTFVRNARVFLMKLLLGAHRDAKTASAKRAFKLEDVEKLAHDVLEECPPSKWPPRNGGVMYLAYGVMPNWEAYGALAYVHSYRGRLPMQLDAQPGGSRLKMPDVGEMKKAAEYYDKGASLMPDDWYDLPAFRWYGLESWFRAGGLSVRELRQREAAALKSEVESRRFANSPLETNYPPRNFSQKQNRALAEQVGVMGPQADRLTVKAVPTIDARGMPMSWNGAELFTPEMAKEYPG
ncbi:hypothetical protein JCM9279_004421, partial [Rhodotorula babjevae]